MENKLHKVAGKISRIMVEQLWTHHFFLLFDRASVPFIMKIFSAHFFCVINIQCSNTLV
jgi:hypothetical protein